MDHCESCVRLTEGFHGIGIPAHLTRVATLRSDGKVTFRYECAHCGANWDWCRGQGWHDVDAAPPPPPPLLTRLVDAARARFGIPH